VVVPADRPTLALELAGADVVYVTLGMSRSTLLAGATAFHLMRNLVRTVDDDPVVWLSDKWIGPYETIITTATRLLGSKSCRFVDSFGSVTRRSCAISLRGLFRPLVRNLKAFSSARAMATQVQRLSPPRRTASVRCVAFARLDPAMAIADEPGGSRSHAEGVIGGLQDNGVDVVRVTPIPVVAADRPAPDAVTLHFPIESDVHGELVPALLDRILAAQLRHVDLSRVDVVYARHSLFGTAGIELAARLGVPFVLETNGVQVAFRSQYDSIRFRRTASRVEAEVFRRASLVLAVSECVRDEVLRVAPGAQVMVIPNGVDARLFKPDQPEARRQRQSLEVGEDEVLIGFFGRFYQWHGMETLAAAAPVILSDRPNVHFLLVGNGPHRETVERATLPWASRVHISGIVPHDTVPPLMQACDILVSPHSPMKGFVGSPMKVFEYLISGRAVVASDLEQIGKVVRHEETGLLFPPGDSDAFTEAVLRLVDDPALRRRLSESARADALTLHTWSAKMAVMLSAITS
jgi:glycosyltransferase involved in cell wall biosynthesis